MLIHAAEPVLELEDFLRALPDVRSFARISASSLQRSVCVKRRIERPYRALILGIDLEDAPVARHRAVYAL